jgi:hypothetical protein
MNVIFDILIRSFTPVYIDYVQLLQIENTYIIAIISYIEIRNDNRVQT